MPSYTVCHVSSVLCGHFSSMYVLLVLGIYLEYRLAVLVLDLSMMIN